MARFFKLTTEISQIVRKANLTAAQLKIWLYFTEIDHNFPDFFLGSDRHQFRVVDPLSSTNEKRR